MKPVIDYSKIHGEKCWDVVQKVAPCENACPAGINIPGYIMALANGKFKEALAIIRDTMPFPGVCGRVCHHPCEQVCNRSVIDDSIAIRSLKRFAYDYGKENKLLLATDVKRASGGTRARVAIIGSGPAGLTAGLYLNRMGYQVTIFEANSKPGGMPVEVIPEFILPADVVSSEVDYFLSQGIDIKTGLELGKDFTIDELKEKGYKAILLATGLQKSRMLKLPGSELKGIVPALSFLKETRADMKNKISGKVLVIGGGNVAIDAARVAIRLGSSSVHLACLESRNQMPAFSWEIEACEKEGVKVHNSLAPKAYLPKGLGSAVGSLEFQRVKMLKVNQNGGLSWDLEEGPGAKVTLEADVVVVAIGQYADLDFLGSLKLEADNAGRLLIGDNLMTSSPGIFAAGDMVLGRGTIVEAIAAGKKAAASINAYISGTKEFSLIPSYDSKDIFKLEKKMIPEFFIVKRRWETIQIPQKNRVRSFEEIELGYTVQQAVEEAKRCLNCKMCSSCMFERKQICFDQADRILAGS